MLPWGTHPYSCAITPNLLLASTLLCVVPFIYVSQMVCCSTQRNTVAAHCRRRAPPASTRLLLQGPFCTVKMRKRFHSCSACQSLMGGTPWWFCYKPSIQWDGRKWGGGQGALLTCASGRDMSRASRGVAAITNLQIPWGCVLLEFLTRLSSLNPHVL